MAKLKFTKTSPHAAYVVAEGVTDPDEAAANGLVVVESAPDGTPSAYGKYADGPTDEPEE